MFKQILSLFVLLLTIGGTNLFADDQAEKTPTPQVYDTRGRTYAFFSEGGVDIEPTLHIGVGGEVPVYRGLHLGAELGAVRFGRHFSEGTAGIVSANGAYQFLNTSGSKVLPFVTAGLSLAAPGPAPALNFGGGANYWFHDRMGIRFEFRDYAFSDANLYEVRVAFTFRGKR